MPERMIETTGFKVSSRSRTLALEHVVVVKVEPATELKQNYQRCHQEYPNRHIIQITGLLQDHATKKM